MDQETMLSNELSLNPIRSNMLNKVCIEHLARSRRFLLAAPHYYEHPEYGTWYWHVVSEASTESVNTTN